MIGLCECSKLLLQSDPSWQPQAVVMANCCLLFKGLPATGKCLRRASFAMSRCPDKLCFPGPACCSLQDGPKAAQPTWFMVTCCCSCGDCTGLATWLCWMRSLLNPKLWTSCCVRCAQLFCSIHILFYMYVTATMKTDLKLLFFVILVIVELQSINSTIL